MNLIQQVDMYMYIHMYMSVHYSLSILVMVLYMCIYPLSTHTLQVSAIRDRLQGIQTKLNDQLGHIDMAKSSSIDKVRLEFQDFEMALRKRQAHMESLVEEAVSH